MTRWALAALATTALILSGCGSSDDSSTTETTPSGGGLPGCQGGKVMASSAPKGNVQKPNSSPPKTVSDPSIDMALVSVRVSEENNLCSSVATAARIGRGTEFVLKTKSGGTTNSYNIVIGGQGQGTVSDSGKKVANSKATTHANFLTTLIPNTGFEPTSKFGVQIIALDGTRAADAVPPGGAFLSFPGGKPAKAAAFE